MFLKIAHNNESLELVQKLKDIIDVEALNEDVFSSRKKRFHLNIRGELNNHHLLCCIMMKRSQ